MPDLPLVLRSRAERRPPPPIVLDASQAAAVAQPADRPLLVLGEAGHGKTTVLVARVARLWNASRGAERPPRVAVLVPHEGLVAALQPQLLALGVDVAPWTFDRFAAKQARRAFRRLPRESTSTPPAVARVKRSASLGPALAAIAARAPGVIDDDTDAPPLTSRPTPARVGMGDLQHLFGDRVLLAGTGASPYAIDAVLERTRVQFSRTTEAAWSHVTDRERLVPIDRRSIDHATADEDVATIDVEDYPLLFAIDALRAARRGERPRDPVRFDVVAIDEAQELGTWELALIGRCLRPGGALVVAGDADQQTDENTEFAGWDATMRALGAEEHTVATLPLGYRCPPDVVALARAVRSGGPAAAPVVSFDDAEARAVALADAVGTIVRRDPRATVGVVCRRPDLARRLGARLAGVHARLVFDGRFPPRGASVTVTAEVKGLELDYVVIPDADAATYPDDPASRRALYVAITRARSRLLLAALGPASAILRPAPQARASSS